MNQSPPIQPAISLIDLQVTDTLFQNNFCGVKELPGNLEFNVSFVPRYLEKRDTKEKESHRFGITFKIDFIDKSECFKFNIEATAIFESTFKIDDEFLTSNFAKLNAPAIAFPFIRAFISNFTVNAGYSPIILPSFNFSLAANANEENTVE